MATYSAGVALALDYEVASGTTGSYSPGGDNRAVFGTIVCGGFSGLPSITELRHGGSGGTVITRVGSDLTWVAGNGSHGVFADAAGPTGSTTLFGDWAATPLQSAIAALHYSGVDQTTPFSGHVDATPTFASGVTTTVASVTVTGCTAGQTIVCAVGALSDAVALSAFSEVDPLNPIIRVSDVTGTFVGVAMLEKVATGSSETLSVNLNAASSAGLYWTARGARVNNAAGGGSPVGRADETDTAFGLARLQLRAAGISTEADTAQALAARAIRAVGLASEAETALQLSGMQIRAAGLSTETDTALQLSRVQIRAAGVSVEADTALQLSRLQTRAVGLAAETDTAQALDPASGNTVGMASEADSAFALAGRQLRAVGMSTEADTALALPLVQVRGVGLAPESDTAFQLAVLQRAVVGLAAENDSAYALADGVIPVVRVLSAPPSGRRDQETSRAARQQTQGRTHRAQTRTR